MQIPRFLVYILKRCQSVNLRCEHAINTPYEVVTLLIADDEDA